MPPSPPLAFRDRLDALSATGPGAAVERVDLILDGARAAGASDVHLLPTLAGLEVRWRVDGVLVDAGLVPRSLAANVVARLKVLAELLTYRCDVPQEGRIRGTGGGPGEGEVRVSTFPSLHGEKAVIRLFAGAGRYLRLADLNLPNDVAAGLDRALKATSGAVILSGPAGSGKTTTLYACLREIVAATRGERSLATLEDPIEVAVDGVSQAQVNPAAGFDLATGLRSLLRQDPEVIAVGEVRDRVTADIAVQAALTGHLVLSTFHAASGTGALARLADMGIEPYLIRSGVVAIVSQRLVRALCPACSRPSDDAQTRLGLPVGHDRVAVGCEACRGTGYLGRIVLAELVDPDRLGLGSAILARSDVHALNERARRAGLVTLADRARAAVEAGRTSAAEVRRVLGFSQIPDLAESGLDNQRQSS